MSEKRPNAPTHWVNCQNCGKPVEVAHRAPAPETCANCPTPDASRLPPDYDNPRRQVVR